MRPGSKSATSFFGTPARRPDPVGRETRTPKRAEGELLARRPNLEHLRTALGTFTFRRRAAVFHGYLHGIFDLPLGLALHTVSFCCHVESSETPALGQCAPGPVLCAGYSH